MAPFLSYKDVFMVLAEPDPLVSRNISAALFTRGMRDIAVCKNASELRDAVNLKPVDIVMCDVELPGGDFVKTVQDIRHGRMGHNPFTTMIASAGPSAQGKMQALAAAGIDDIVRKPAQANLVLGRLETLVRTRKPFIVTDSYVGPTRRSTARPGDSAFVYDVPNTFKAKVVDGVKHTRIPKLIENGLDAVEEGKTQSQPKAIGALTGRILANYEGQGNPEEAKRDLGYLIAKSNELASRHRNSAAPHIADIATSMAGLAQRIAGTEAPKQIELQLLSNLAEAMRLSLSGNEESSAIVREIAQTIRQFTKPQ